jgi:hypothetical protein
MSLFQCEKCGCVENTALCNWAWNRADAVENSYVIADMCSACDPEIGKWHNEFPRVYLPLHMFKTNSMGNLQNIENGDTNYRAYEITKA